MDNLLKVGGRSSLAKHELALRFGGVLDRALLVIEQEVGPLKITDPDFGLLGATLGRVQERKYLAFKRNQVGSGDQLDSVPQR